MISLTAVVWHTPTSHRLRSQQGYSMRVSVYKGGRKRPAQLALVISETIMRRMHWLVGDKVAVGHLNGRLYLRRIASNEVGYKLSAIASSAKRKLVEGRAHKADVKFAAPPWAIGVKSRVYTIDEIEMNDENINV